MLTDWGIEALERNVYYMTWQNQKNSPKEVDISPPHGMQLILPVIKAGLNRKQLIIKTLDCSGNSLIAVESAQRSTILNLHTHEREPIYFVVMGGVTEVGGVWLGPATKQTWNAGCESGLFVSRTILMEK